MTTSNTKVAVFKDKQIRKTILNNEWWFSVVDIVEALTDSEKPRDYWYRMKKREFESSGIQLSTDCQQLKLLSADGKKSKTVAKRGGGVAGKARIETEKELNQSIVSNESYLGLINTNKQLKK